ncbi:ras-related protein Rab-1A [Platysternon megacephalum]|uniref:Ras-related protein Rab-1A n=1 Tax=Platysternon megacephalum TaxID=55544 RepID=A0A4D9E5R5_9SAUR|nr:ras-related protein Rab-1A [Platysternon megacephalum]
MVRGVRGWGKQEREAFPCLCHISVQGYVIQAVNKTKKHPRSINQLKYCNHLDSPRALIQRQCPDICNIYMKYTEKYCKLIKFLKRVKFTQKYLFFAILLYVYLISSIIYAPPPPTLSTYRLLQV